MLLLERIAIFQEAKHFSLWTAFLQLRQHRGLLPTDDRLQKCQRPMSAHETVSRMKKLNVEGLPLEARMEITSGIYCGVCLPHLDRVVARQIFTHLMILPILTKQYQTTIVQTLHLKTYQYIVI